MELNDLLRMAFKKEASDVHIKAGIVPVMRRHGKLRPIDSHLPIFTGEMIEDMIRNLLSPKQYEDFKIKKEADLGYGIKGLGRFRFNIFRQRGTSRIVIRNIPYDVPQLENLGLPDVIYRIAKFERGLVLLTGATGSGKSSTIAALIDYINKNKNRHILTIEDPIEFLIRDRKSIITQRELGVDALDFPTALRSSLRQDPDVIFIGEMRDRETIETALTAAETGHLVFSTLHTLDCAESINRILSVFSELQQKQVRLQLGSVLRAIVSQRLAQRADGKGFVPAVEVMINNSRIREMIENPDRTKDISAAIEEGHISFSMQTFDQSLFDLVSKEVINYDEAMRLTDNNEDFAIRFGGISHYESNERDQWRKDIKYQKKVSNSWDELSEVEIETNGTPPIPKKKLKKS
ncbi:MAG: type IV pilus twitching motility protein PilT [Bdellovibrionaceae bacterium]|nr:type IV pilus twitching motility protein PilT [Pseudobdellovibrionaceae bacterium]